MKSKAEHTKKQAWRMLFPILLLAAAFFTAGCGIRENSNDLINFTQQGTAFSYDTDAGIVPVETAFLSENLVLIPTPVTAADAGGAASGSVGNSSGSSGGSAAGTSSWETGGGNLSASGIFSGTAAQDPGDGTTAGNPSQGGTGNQAVSGNQTGTAAQGGNPGTDSGSGNTAVPDGSASVLLDGLSAKSALLINLSDKSALYNYSVYEQIYPASITKLMTALLALEYGNFYETVTISENALNLVPDAKMCGFKAGDKILLEDLLSSMLVCSGNDAAVALAEHISGTQEAFVERMNRRAAELGAISTHFCNPHGLHEDDHQTTAYDTYLIMNELVHYDKFISIISKSVYTASYQTETGGTVSKTFHSTNAYFAGSYAAPDGVEIVGGKTGSTQKAGRCLALFVKDARQKLYVAEVFGAENNDALYKGMNTLLSLIAEKPE